MNNPFAVQMQHRRRDIMRNCQQQWWRDTVCARTTQQTAVKSITQ